jgi:hypothetical protein
MKQMKQKNIQSKKFNCIKCSYHTNKRSEFERHINTNKHKKRHCETKKSPTCDFCNKIFSSRTTLWRHKKSCKFKINNPKTYNDVSQKLAKISQCKFCCECGKSYKHASSLSKHKTNCKHLHNINENTEIVPTNNVEKLLEKLIEKNNDILKENKELRSEIKNLKLGNTTINSNNTNTNNSFNINMFLNEKCKNAMNLEDFVKKIKLTLEDLNFTKENGYTKGISNIFIKNLNDMDVTERPIHCSDQKRLQFYVKNDNEWTKDKNNEKIDNTIEKVSRKQLKSIQDWIKANPDYTESDSKMEEYFILVRNITQPNDNKNLKNIKKKVGENVKLDK